MNKLGKLVLLSAVGVAVTLGTPKTVSALTQLYIDQEAQAQQTVQQTAADLTNSMAYRNACRVELEQAIASGDSIRISRADDAYKHSKDLVLWQYDQYDNAKKFLENVQKRNKTQDRKDEYNSYDKSQGSYDIAAAQYTQAVNTVNNIKVQIASIQSSINTLKSSGNTSENAIATINTLNAQLTALNGQLAIAENDVTAKKAALELRLDDLEQYRDILFVSNEGNVFATYWDSHLWDSEREWNK